MSKKVQVRLFGSTGHKTVTLPVPSGKGSILIPPEDTNRHTRAFFACLRDLEPRFDAAGISEADYLVMVRSELEVASLSELSDSMWCRLGATLDAALRHPCIFDRLVSKVKAHTAAKQPPLTDATPVIFADPEDTTTSCFVIRRDRTTGEETVVFIGELTDGIRDRCQDHADKTRCIVQLYHSGQKPQSFYPSTKEVK